MAKTNRESYRDWEIEVTCAHQARPWLGMLERKKFSATGRATLTGKQSSPSDWVDSRPQIVTLGLREFPSGIQCTDVLMQEIKMLIDALRK